MIISPVQTPPTKLNFKDSISNFRSKITFDFLTIPQVIFNRIEKKITNGFDASILMKNLRKDGSSYWSINTFSPIKDSHYTFTSEITYDFNLINKVEELYNVITKIEKHNSIQIAEKYLAGYLEEKNKTLNQLIAA